MAAKKTDTIAFPVDVRLKEEDVQKVTALVAEEIPDAQKIAVVVRDLINDVVNGGMMITGSEIQLIEDSTGIQIENGIEDILPFLSEKSGMQDGMHRVTVLIDPANYPAYEELAKTQERTVDSIMQEVVEMVQDNQWAYELHPQPRRVLMTERDAVELEEILGKKFQTGTELAALLREALTPESLFGESEAAESNVGQEA